MRELRESQGIDGKPFVSEIKRMLKQDKHYQVRDEAIWALYRIEGKSALVTLADSLRDEHWVVRGSAAMVIGEIGPNASSVVGELT